MKININISNYFSESELNNLAKSTGFVQRKSFINGFNFLVTFTTGLINTPETSLSQLASFLNNTCNLNITPQAIDERINEKAKEFLEFCLLRAIQLSMKKINIENELINCFSHIYIIDSTNFDLHPSLKDMFKGYGGNASKSSIRIQLMYDYLKGKMYIEIGDIRKTDSKTLLNMIKNNSLDTSGSCLFLQDLGYFKTETFMLINDNKKKFISKFKSNVKIHDTTGKEINLVDFLKKEKPDKIDLKIKIGNLTCRLVGSKLPENITNQRRRKANRNAKKKGRNLISKGHSLFLSYGFFITNLSEEYTPSAIFTIYRLRWQIELIFKTWKSILKIHKINTKRECRVYCEIYGKLIIAVLIHKIHNYFFVVMNKVLSLHKMHKYFISLAAFWAEKIVDGKKSHIHFLKKIESQIIKLCKKTKQKNKPIIEELLLSLMSLNQERVALA